MGEWIVCVSVGADSILSIALGVYSLLRRRPSEEEIKGYFPWAWRLIIAGAGGLMLTAQMLRDLL